MSAEQHGVVFEPPIYQDMCRAAPPPRTSSTDEWERGSDAFWELIREAKRLAREGQLDGTEHLGATGASGRDSGYPVAGGD